MQRGQLLTARKAKFHVFSKMFFAETTGRYGNINLTAAAKFLLYSSRNVL